MKPRELLATAKVPGGGELRCYRHDRDFYVFADRTELMSSRVHGSEEQLAELALVGLDGRPDLRVLLGGLGMGYTLARTLALAPADARIDVVELVPEVVDWNARWFGDLCGGPLRDPRVHVRVADVAAAIAAAAADEARRVDAVVLDVDNGPEGLTRAGNDDLYGERGLAVAAQALRPGGVLAVWSSAPDATFVVRLRRAGFDVAEHVVRARRARGPRRTIWIATRAVANPDAGAVGGDGNAAPSGPAIWHVYLVRCRDGALYAGIATDVDRRLDEHRTGRGARSLRGRGPLELVLARPVGDRGRALRIEARFKTLAKAEKERLAVDPPKFDRWMAPLAR